jgi:hypothetical protein
VSEAMTIFGMREQILMPVDLIKLETNVLSILVIQKTIVKTVRYKNKILRFKNGMYSALTGSNKA